MQYTKVSKIYIEILLIENHRRDQKQQMEEEMRIHGIDKTWLMGMEIGYKRFYEYSRFCPKSINRIFDSDTVMQEEIVNNFVSSLEYHILGDFNKMLLQRCFPGLYDRTIDKYLSK